MPAIATISLTDAQATPVAHIFAPAKTQSDMALLEDRSSGVYIGYNKLTFNLKRPVGPSANASRNLKLSVLLETPKMEVVSNNTINGIAPSPTVSYRPTVEMIWTFPERCSLLDRKDLRSMLYGLLTNSFMVSAVESYELPY